jgi:hypothetical protein
MPTATPPALVVVLKPGRLPETIAHAILARLAALNPTDPTLIALLAEYQTVTGQVFDT